MRALKVLLPICALVISLGSFVYLAETRPTPEPSVADARPWPVETVSVTRADHRPVLRVFGEIVAGREAVIRAAVDGEVVAVMDAYRDGAQVAAGAQLLQIDRFDYETTLAERRAEHREAEARLRELEARRALEQEALDRDRDLVSIAERELSRQQSLLNRGVVSDQAVDSAREALLRIRQTLAIRENTVAAETARIDQQHATIARLAARTRRAERDVARTRIAAPFSGLLTEIGAEQGQRLALNEAVARIIDPSRLEARFQLSERQYGRLLSCRDGLLGRSVSVVWEIGEASRTYAGVIERVDAEISMDRGGVALFARLTDITEATDLRPGGFVAVDLADCAFEDVALLPASAVRAGGWVYLVDADNRLTERRVRVAAQSGDQVVIGGGLTDGEQVVVSLVTEIRPGTVVDPIPRQQEPEDSLVGGLR